DAVELLDDLVRCRDREIVYGACGKAAYAPHGAFELGIRVLTLAGLGFGNDHEPVHLRIAALRGAQRDDDAAVLTVLAKEAAFGFGVDADHDVLRAIDHQRAPHGASTGKKRYADAGADHRHMRCALVLFVSEIPAEIQ